MCINIKKKHTLVCVLLILLTLLQIWYQACGFSIHQAILKRQLGVLQLNSKCQRLVKGSAPQDGLCPLLQTLVARPGCHLYFWPTYGYKLKVSKTLSSGSINMLERLTEFRKTVYLLDNQFVIKVYNSGPARWNSCIGHLLGKLVKSFQCPLLKHHSPSTSTC